MLLVVAPTGIAAINAGGVTIHSFFQLPFAPYVRIQKLCQHKLFINSEEDQHYT